MSERVFLTADWKNLLLFNYKVPAQILNPFLPRGCELDMLEDSPFVSLVAFQFLNTRVFGVRWPWHVNFPEINLRFYVNLNGRRGVCFIREYVPLPLIAAAARVLYNEPYRSAKMGHSVVSEGGKTVAQFGLSDRGSPLKLRVLGKNAPFLPQEGSVEHFFKEHELGVGRDRQGSTLTYKVSHPRWRVFPVESASAQLDWGVLYGSSFSFLSSQKPDSVCFAEGSGVKVYSRGLGPL